VRTGAQTGAWGKLRVLLVAATALAMAMGLYGGLVRIGVALPGGGSLAELHGPLMIAGVFGALISLERAVAMGLRWAFLAPVASLLGAFALVAGLPPTVGATLFVLSAGVLLAASVRILILQPALFTLALVVGAAAELVGNLVWLVGATPPDAAGWWLSFLVCTIAAERLELSRILRHGWAASYAFAAGIATMLAGAAFGILSSWGSLLLGLGFLCVTIWLLRFDIAIRTIRSTGRTRFFASAMLAGYLWLGAAGLALLFAPGAVFAYDIALHTVLVGFVLSMVFGHALIILPAVTGLKLSYHRALYLPLSLLHLSVALRLAGGLLENSSARVGSGILTVAALLSFAAVLAVVSRARA